MNVPNHAHIQTLVDERAVEIKKREAANALVEKANEQIMAHLVGANLQRLQLVSGAIVQIVTPAERKNIIAELLQENGVAPEVIKASTLLSPVKSFIRVDPPKMPKGAELSTDPGRPVDHPAGDTPLEPPPPAAPETIQ